MAALGSTLTLAARRESNIRAMSRKQPPEPPPGGDARMLESSQFGSRPSRRSSLACHLIQRRIQHGTHSEWIGRILQLPLGTHAFQH